MSVNEEVLGALKKKYDFIISIRDIRERISQILEKEGDIDEEDKDFLVLNNPVQLVLKVLDLESKVKDIVVNLGKNEEYLLLHKELYHAIMDEDYELCSKIKERLENL